MRAARTVLLEALVVAVTGLALALAANALSPRGLRLARNYFPVLPAVDGPATVGQTAAISNSPPTDPSQAAALRLQQRGFAIANGNEVFELFKDPRYEQGLIVFVDARDDDHFSAGHIPGAWQFNHYRPENYLPAILPACLNAMKVVVYCTGGQCEDSEFAAVALRDAGIPRENLVVYLGGITEWTTQGRSVETGARGSGQMLTPAAKP
ncbi:MAG: rhodanese-like domain-containing protein [Verrucomicrobia bacterium]|nr:rhodanese-like domain-containing protein [Verrucomicrobiota bacterium]